MNVQTEKDVAMDWWVVAKRSRASQFHFQLYRHGSEASTLLHKGMFCSSTVLVSDGGENGPPTTRLVRNNNNIIGNEFKGISWGQSEEHLGTKKLVKRRGRTQEQER